jgi:hypothetical protein
VSADEPTARVLVYSRAQCHLCDVVMEVVESVCGELGERYRTVDIDSSADLVARYGEAIPVVLVDGSQIAQWRLAPDVLRRALARA